MDHDPFKNLLTSISEKIKVEKEHKELMKRINEESNISQQLENAVNLLKKKIEEQVKKPEANATVDQPKKTIESSFDEQQQENFNNLVFKLKDILTTKNDTHEEKIKEKTAAAVEQSIEDIKPKEETASDYIEVLEQLSDNVVKEKH